MSAPADTEAQTDALAPMLECGPIGLNSADIPGGCGGAAALDAPLEMACGLLWEPIDFSPWHSPIGAQIALEYAANAKLARLPRD